MRYDMGGYAWDNTELVPTLWLWLMFMRTGRPDVFFTGGKAFKTRLGGGCIPYGERTGAGIAAHVRHWGLSSRRPRIAMAGHHRFYYYMTGDHRLENIFEELKDNEKTFLNTGPAGGFL